MKGQKLRDCVQCGAPIYAKRYQNNDKVRTCSGNCAQLLAHQEHPELMTARQRWLGRTGTLP